VRIVTRINVRPSPRMEEMRIVWLFQWPIVTEKSRSSVVKFPASKENAGNFYKNWAAAQEFARQNAAKSV
jgi:hypothetical protein